MFVYWQYCLVYLIYVINVKAWRSNLCQKGTFCEGRLLLSVVYSEGDVSNKL